MVERIFEKWIKLSLTLSKINVIAVQSKKEKIM